MNKKKTITIGGIIVAAVAIIICIFTVTRTPKQFTQLKAVTTDKEAMQQQIKNSQKKGFTYEFIYQPGCSDCKKIEKDTIKPIYKLQRQDKLMVFNAKNKNTQKYLATNGVQTTPTLIVKYHGYTAYQYSGTKVKTFLTLLKGEDPETHKAIETQNGKPIYNMIVNDEYDYRSAETPVRHNVLEK